MTSFLLSPGLASVWCYNGDEGSCHYFHIGMISHVVSSRLSGQFYWDCRSLIGHSYLLCQESSPSIQSTWTASALQTFGTQGQTSLCAGTLELRSSKRESALDEAASIIYRLRYYYTPAQSRGFRLAHSPLLFVHRVVMHRHTHTNMPR